MQLTSMQCRAQELIQRERAQSEPLANVRAVALRAALAWGTEAKSAERREIRKQRRLAISEMITVQQQRTDDEIEMSDNENPDRGFAKREGRGKTMVSFARAISDTTMSSPVANETASARCGRAGV